MKAIRTNWMYMGLYEWTISCNADYSDRAFYVNYVGGVFYFSVDGNNAVRPVFNLESSLTYKSGSGTESDPIRLGD